MTEVNASSHLSNRVMVYFLCVSIALCSRLSNLSYSLINVLTCPYMDVSASCYWFSWRRRCSDNWRSLRYITTLHYVMVLFTSSLHIDISSLWCCICWATSRRSIYRVDLAYLISVLYAYYKCRWRCSIVSSLLINFFIYCLCAPRN